MPPPGLEYSLKDNQVPWATLLIAFAVDYVVQLPFPVYEFSSYQLRQRVTSLLIKGAAVAPFNIPGVFISRCRSYLPRLCRRASLSGMAPQSLSSGLL